MSEQKEKETRLGADPQGRLEALVSQQQPDTCVIEMQSFGYDCAMCGEYSTDGYAVPWYEEPVRSGESDGYCSVCKTCYNRWAEWDSSFAG
ncbi:MAG: hypothetical protein H6966_09885 [Chromatiaceae bacterium]|nr:hypothetical protein [Chromatiaceae bacterium]